MTLEDLKETSEKLASEMSTFFSEKRTKAGSARIRKLLGEIKKNATTLKRNLMEIDRK